MSQRKSDVWLCVRDGGNTDNTRELQECAVCGVKTWCYIDLSSREVSKPSEVLEEVGESIIVDPANEVLETEPTAPDKVVLEAETVKHIMNERGESIPDDVYCIECREQIGITALKWSQIEPDVVGSEIDCPHCGTHLFLRFKYDEVEEEPVAAPLEKSLDEMTEDELRARLKALEGH